MRHLNQIDLIRVQIALWVLVELLRGSKAPVRDLLQKGKREWQQAGDFVRHPSEIHNQEAAPHEVFVAIDVTSLC